MKNFLHRFHFYTIIAPLSFLTSKTLLLLFSSKFFLFLNAIFNFRFFYRHFISNTFHLQVPYQIQRFSVFFNDPWICVFSYVGEFWVHFKNRAVFILINQLMETLSSRGFLPDECSLNVQKVVKKLIWMNSFLTKMQFFSMLRVFRRENKIRKISLEVSFKNFPNAFKKRLFCRTSLDGY